MAVQREFSVRLAFMAAAAMVVGSVVPCYGCSPATAGVNYTVGDTFWSLPPSFSYYNIWSANNTFKIGDSLVFNFEAGRSNVMQVRKQEYESCSAYKPLKVFNNGPVTIPMPAKGVFYYICSISNYCTLGQKIAIVVNDSPCPLPPNPSPPQSPPPPVAAPSPPPSTGGRPGVSSPPPHYVQGPSPAPTPGSGNNDSGLPEGPPNSAALWLRKGIFGWLSQLVLLAIFVLG